MSSLLLLEQPDTIKEDNNEEEDKDKEDKYKEDKKDEEGEEENKISLPPIPVSFISH
jgi:hypothetical protein